MKLYGKKTGPVPSKDMQTLPLRCVHLDIKDVLKIEMGVKFHITSYHDWALRASKRGLATFVKDYHKTQPKTKLTT